ncbi:MAG TPA: hypothetical protein VFA09_00690 [Ktedonobacteraceae bacterium]|nr:hypothetical protein [Ktedonobacteraceae bacterium]
MEIQIVLRCPGPGRFTEILADEPESTELAIEDCVSQALLQFFETVIVDRVHVNALPIEQKYETLPFSA